MNFKNKRRLQILWQYCLGWSIAFAFLSIIRGEGTRELGSVQFVMWQSIVVSMIAGPIFGALSGYAQILTEEYGYKKISLQKLLVLRIVYVLLFIVTMVSLSYLAFGKHITYLEFAFEPGSFAIYLYIVSVDIFMFGLRQVNLFFGSNNLWKLFSGKFYTPREEERIFMFLDLQSSTQHAERLGHIKYSKMIQDCFNDLGIVAANEAEIYQYVGDEAILTWKLQAGLSNQNCLAAYFNFQHQLEGKKAYYLAQYQCLPLFKAGIHSGLVTVTEVGKFKKEIAYHGDTINTAARIQGMCNELSRTFLISESLKNQLVQENFNFEKLKMIGLRGKEEQLLLYAVGVNTPSLV